MGGENHEKECFPRLLGSLTLIGVLCFGAPSPLFASSANDGDVELSARQKTVTVGKQYRKYETIKETIDYKQGGWEGTLWKINQQDAGDFILVNYRGTVFCSGPCTMSE